MRDSGPRRPSCAGTPGHLAEDTAKISPWEAFQPRGTTHPQQNCPLLKQVSKPVGGGRLASSSAETHQALSGQARPAAAPGTVPSPFRALTQNQGKEKDTKPTEQVTDQGWPPTPTCFPRKPEAVH